MNESDVIDLQGAFPNSASNFYLSCDAHESGKSNRRAEMFHFEFEVGNIFNILYLEPGKRKDYVIARQNISYEKKIC